MLIRSEQPDEADAIDALIRRAFAPTQFSHPREAEIVRALRRDGALTLSLVAVDERVVVGHVAFSLVTSDGVHDEWFGLGPISVCPERQRQGIGRMLVLAGLAALEARAANGCAVIGNPAIYSRFGFTSDGRLQYADIPERFVQHVVFRGPPPSGTLEFARAFAA